MGDLPGHSSQDIIHRTGVFSGVRSRGDDDFDTQIHDFRLTDVKGNVVKDVIAG
jgi:hypothetical protein